MSMSSLVEIRDLLATERVKRIQKHDTYILDWNTGYVCSDLVTSLLQVVNRRDKLIVKTSSVFKLNASCLNNLQHVCKYQVAAGLMKPMTWSSLMTNLHQATILDKTVNKIHWNFREIRLTDFFGVLPLLCPARNVSSDCYLRILNVIR